MKTLRIVATLIMSAGFGSFGMAKIVEAAIVTDSRGWSRLSEGQWMAIGIVEVAAVIALLLALVPQLRALGIAAGAGLTTLAVCAVVYHLANGDPFGDIVPAIIQGGVAAGYTAITVRMANAEGRGATSTKLSS